MVNERDKPAGPKTQEPDRTSELPGDVVEMERRKQQPEVEEADRNPPLKVKPQVPDVNPPVQPGHRDREQV